MRKRLILSAKRITVILIIGIAYYFFASVSGFAIPCVFSKITGLLCPGCGITRMLAAALRGNFKEAYGYNRLLFLTLPVISLVLAVEEIKYIRTGSRQMFRLSQVILWSEIILLLIFGIIRNII